MKYYHGTTLEKLRVIRRQGLPIGSFVSPDKSVAGYFACKRSKWNNIRPVVLEFHLTRKQVTETRLDRSGRREATTKIIAFPCGQIESGQM